MNFTITKSKNSKIIQYSSPLSFIVKGQSLDSIIGAQKDKSEMIVLGDIVAETVNDNIIVSEKSSGKVLTVIFNPPIKVIYENVCDEETMIDEKVFSLCQIDNLLNYYKIKTAYFKNKDNELINYFDSKYFLTPNENIKELTIINYDKKYILEKNDSIITKKCFDKLSLSKYFDN